ncbi:hypothetical protein ACHAPE_002684 [Trichoderma viride]
MRASMLSAGLVPVVVMLLAGISTTVAQLAVHRLAIEDYRNNGDASHFQGLAPRAANYGEPSDYGYYPPPYGEETSSATTTTKSGVYPAPPAGSSTSTVSNVTTKTETVSTTHSTGTKTSSESKSSTLAGTVTASSSSDKSHSSTTAEGSSATESSLGLTTQTITVSLASTTFVTAQTVQVSSSHEGYSFSSEATSTLSTSLATSSVSTESSTRSLTEEESALTESTRSLTEDLPVPQHWVKVSRVPNLVKHLVLSYQRMVIVKQSIRCYFDVSIHKLICGYRYRGATQRKWDRNLINQHNRGYTVAKSDSVRYRITIGIQRPFKLLSIADYGQSDYGYSGHHLWYHSSSVKRDNDLVYYINLANIIWGNSYRYICACLTPSGDIQSSSTGTWSRSASWVNTTSTVTETAAQTSDHFTITTSAWTLNSTTIVQTLTLTAPSVSTAKPWSSGAVNTTSAPSSLVSTTGSQLPWNTTASEQTGVRTITSTISGSGSANSTAASNSAGTVVVITVTPTGGVTTSGNSAVSTTTESPAWHRVWVIHLEQAPIQQYDFIVWANRDFNRLEHSTDSLSFSVNHSQPFSPSHLELYSIWYPWNISPVFYSFQHDVALLDKPADKVSKFQ